MEQQDSATNDASSWLQNIVPESTNEPLQEPVPFEGTAS